MINNERKIAVITASYSGIGSELSKLLMKDGYHMVLVNRDKARTERQITELRKLSSNNQDIVSVTADLSDHESIKWAAAQIGGLRPHIDLLIHNAGILLDTRQSSPQGNDLHFEVNTTAPYLLTRLLKPLLAAAANPIVIVVGSSAMRMVRKVSLTELQKPQRMKKFALYAQSKLATTSAFLALSKEFTNDGIKLRIVDPGPNKTPMANNTALPGLFKLFRIFFSSPDVGAKRIYEAAHAPSLKEKTGIYIEKGKAVRPPQIVLDQKFQNELLLLLKRITGA
ncbi:SDR family NAD(P)-dependent oxidoreductase [Paenibacillus sp. HB172176]|uniref:SDR family NAD(P)-dependent oxidoreductase n=1 Tax=Paenibacillus sp. HB172176 TaxID=2493690 RepID=UPI00143AEE4E|nr:SDR family NAD(P)-dependent oxidoreductase [Paenibacillus sp. HB172176]